MVCAASGAILNAVDVAMIMHHLVKQGGGNLLNGACERTGTDVDLMGSTLFADPSVIPQGEVAIGLGRLLDRDSGP